MNTPPPKKRYPRSHTLTVMGPNHQSLGDSLLKTLENLSIKLDEGSTSQKQSAKGTYLSLTLSVVFENEEKEKQLYEALKNSPLVKFVL